MYTRSTRRWTRVLSFAAACPLLFAVAAHAREGEQEPQGAAAFLILPVGPQCTMLAPDVAFEAVEVPNGFGVRIRAKDPQDVELVQKSVDLLMLRAEVQNLEAGRQGRDTGRDERASGTTPADAPSTLISMDDPTC